MNPCCIFSFPLTDGGPKSRLAFGAPHRILHAERLSDVRSVLREAEEHARQGNWVAGFVSYDAAPAFDTTMCIPGGTDHAASLPLAWFAIFDQPLPDFVLDAPGITESAPELVWRADCNEAQYLQTIEILRSRIQAGEAYQINHTFRLTAQRPEHFDTLSWFAQLHTTQPDAYAAWINLQTEGHGAQILSLSPELFFRCDGEILTTRPMKGTARRGRNTQEDQEMAQWLLHSEKNRAENLMIVDLLRNDLSRIAQPHSVRADPLFALERHPTLWQMTSTIRARRLPGTLLDTLFAALFPCGSVTGAPKLKAMELIAQLENSPRGLYCGAIGLLKPGGDAIFNVAIRTLSLGPKTICCGVGGGITWDSNAQEEYAEARLKARFLEPETARARPSGLFETLRLDEGQYGRLERHLMRLGDSADYFGFPLDRSHILSELTRLAQKNPSGRHRVRLDLMADGTVSALVAPFPHTPHHPTFLIRPLPSPLHPHFLHHKTKERQHYDLTHAEALKIQADLFDVLLLNEAGELTEFTRGNLILELEGQHYTPPLACGLLDGVLRREMIENQGVIERVLTPADLKRASRILFINSLRGEIEVHPAR